jgi:hypothetical protein
MHILARKIKQMHTRYPPNKIKAIVLRDVHRKTPSSPNLRTISILII